MNQETGTQRTIGSEEVARRTADVWTYPNGLGRSVVADLVDYTVVATDGEIGHIDDVTDAVNEATHGVAIVVDTGFWIFGKKRLIPAGVIDAIDAQQRTVRVKLTKDQIRHAPDYIAGSLDTSSASEAHDEHRAQVTDYYSRWWG